MEVHYSSEENDKIHITLLIPHRVEIWISNQRNFTSKLQEIWNGGFIGILVYLREGITRENTYSKDLKSRLGFSWNPCFLFAGKELWGKHTEGKNRFEKFEIKFLVGILVFSFVGKELWGKTNRRKIQIRNRYMIIMKMRIIKFSMGWMLFAISMKSNIDK